MASVGQAIRWDDRVSLNAMLRQLAEICPAATGREDVMPASVQSLHFRAHENPIDVFRTARDLVEGELSAHNDVSQEAYWGCGPWVEFAAEGGALSWAISWRPKQPATDSFAETPQTLGEVRAGRSRNAQDWTPRDLLVKLLREHDSGECKLEAVVVSFRTETQEGFWSATPDRTTALGLAAALMLGLGGMGIQ